MRVVPFIVVVLVTGVAAGQRILWQQAGVQDLVHIGVQGVFLGDIDGDGYEDLVESAARFEPLVRTGVSESQVHSGRDGRTMRIDGIEDPTYHYDALLPAGDVDGDGIRDYARARVDHSSLGRDIAVEVRSGRTGKLIWEVLGPWNDEYGRNGMFTGNLDADGDGRPDLVVGARRENFYQGAVYVYDNTGRLRYKLAPLSISSLGGTDDLDGDGADEILIGRGTVLEVRSGRTGALIRTVGPDPNEAIGLGSSGRCGDIDGDGTPDFWVSNGAWADPNTVRVFSGRTGQTIHVWHHSPGGGFGRSVAAGDLDLDGIADFAIGSNQDNPGQFGRGALYLHSGRDGALMSRVTNPRTQSFSMYGVAIGAPHPGDPFPVLYVSDPLDGVSIRMNHIGKIYLLRAAPLTVTIRGQACAGTLAEAPRIGFAEEGREGATVHLTHGPPGAAAALLLGLSGTTYGGVPLPFALDPFGFPGCRLHNSIDAIVPVATGTAGNRRGYVGVRFTFPDELARRVSRTLYGQWLVLGAGPTSPGGVSDGLTWPSVR